MSIGRLHKVNHMYLVYLHIVNHILLCYNKYTIRKGVPTIMAPSEAQKRASDKYNREHMTTLGCKVRKEQAVAFKDYAAKQGKTSNTVLKEYVVDCIERDNTKEAGD